MPCRQSDCDQLPPSGSTDDAWYFGWYIVAVATLLVLLTVGLRLGIGPFFFPISDDLGFSRSLLSGIVAIAMFFYGLIMPFVGWLVSRIGTRNTLLLGTALIVTGTVWTVSTRTPIQFTLAFGVVLSVGLALVSPVTVTPIVTRWFKLHRGMALFFLSTGGMAGLAVATPLFSWAISLFGWRNTMLGYVLVFAVIAIPGALFIMRDNAPKNADLSYKSNDNPVVQTEDNEGLSVREALLTSAFWKITIGLMANGFSMTLLGVHGVPMLMDHGFSSSTSALGVGMIGFVAIAGTLMLGRIADMVARKNMLALIYFVRGAAFIGLVLVVSGWQLYTVAIVGGLVWAGAMALASAILADLYGVKLLGILYGLAYAGQQMASTVSSWLDGWGYENFHTHWIAFGSSAAILFLAGFATLSLPARGVSYMKEKRESGPSG